jgi:D(-)-tartrate dehydratase
MRITDIQERSVPISRYADPTVPSGGLTTSMVAVTTYIVREGKPVVGYGFASVGRFAKGGLMRERFIPRLLNAPDGALADEDGMNLDPFRAWETMMTGEKPGGRGERCVQSVRLIWRSGTRQRRSPNCPFTTIWRDGLGRGNG